MFKVSFDFDALIADAEPVITRPAAQAKKSIGPKTRLTRKEMFHPFFPERVGQRDMRPLQPKL